MSVLFKEGKLLGIIFYEGHFYLLYTMHLGKIFISDH